MWGYEGHFQISAQNGAETLFSLLDPGLEPLVRLIGLAVDMPEDYPVASIVPTGCELEASAFESILDRVSDLALADPLSQMIQSHPVAQERQDARVQASSQRAAVLEALAPFDEKDGHVSYVSYPVLVSGWDFATHLVFIVLRLRRQPVDQYQDLTQRKFQIHALRSTDIPTSLIEAAAFEFLGACTRTLRLPEPGSELIVMGREATEVLRAAGRTLMSVPEWKGSGGFAVGTLYQACNEIAAMPYESGEAKGGFIIAAADHQAIAYRARLVQIMPIRQRKAIRKLIESSDAEFSVVTDRAHAYGLGTIGRDYDSAQEAIFKVRFGSLGVWDLIHNDSILMRVRHGQPELIRPKISDAELKARMVALQVSADAIELLTELVLDTTVQQHGALLVISADAEQEAVRLGTLAFRVEPVLLTAALLRRLTAVDGAVLIDLNGYCHAFGVILDGHAQGKGDPARGARYNSAVRYVAEAPCPKLAVVVSEDGYVDMIPKASDGDDARNGSTFTG